jgi:mono/diheme cytochrome c family protein
MPVHLLAAMPPWKDIMTNDEDIAAVVTYIRQRKDWGNNASAVKAEQVKAIREKIKDQSTAFTADLLKTVPESD